MMRIIHLLGTAEPGGMAVARIVAGLGRHADPSRFQIEAWFLGGDGPLVQWLRLQGMHARAISCGGVRRPVEMGRLWLALRRSRPDVVHQHVGGPGVRAMIRAAGGARIVGHLHGRVAESGLLRPAAVLARGADAVIATSYAVASTSPVRCEVIYPGVDVGPEPPARGEGSVIGFAGRLVPLKGVDALIAVMPQVRAEAPGARLEIAGDGPQRAALEGLRDPATTFLGWQVDLRPLFRRWAVLAMPSREEGFGLAALEGMAAGLPVVATRVGGIPEVVQHEVTGLLASHDQLAAALIRLLRNPALRHTMGQMGYRRAAGEFGADRMSERICALYERVASSPGTKEGSP
jgi:glycosyltransferase involved in cell wall biosynthesis